MLQHLVLELVFIFLILCSNCTATPHQLNCSLHPGHPNNPNLAQGGKGLLRRLHVFLCLSVSEKLEYLEVGMKYL